MTLEEGEVLANLSLEEFRYIIEDPVNFDLFFCGVWDYWYQAPVIRDVFDAIAAVFGRQCIYENTELVTSSGKIIRIKDWNGEELIALNNDLKNEYITPTEKVYNGIREIYRVTTHSGRVIHCTDNHPFFSFDRWIELKHLKREDFIAVPRVIPTKGQKTLGRSQLKLLGYLLGDGYTHPQGSIRFTNTNEKLCAEFIKCGIKFNEMKYIEREDARNTTKTVELSGMHPRPNHDNQLRQWLMTIQYKFHKTIKKEIPPIVFQQNKKSIGLFLNRLFACDGYVTLMENHSPSIGYSSSSRKMLRQVRHLLLRFGITSTIRRKNVRCNGKPFRTYELEFANKNDIITFAFNIGIKGKMEKLAVAVQTVERRLTNNNRDVIPVQIRKLTEQARKSRHKKWRDLGFERNLRPNYNPQREMVLRYGQQLQNQQIINYARSDIYWDRIKSIRRIGEHPVYDLKVPTYHNFIASDMYVHNTGKTDIIARRENYNGAINTEDDMCAILVAPAQRQSENLYGRCTKYLNRSPLLLSYLKHGRILMKGIEWENGYTTVNMPIGSSADKVRGFTIDELVFEEAAYIPGAAYDALTDSMLSTAGTEVRIGTPAGKANPLYLSFENAFQIHTIPENRWEAWDITEKDMILRKIPDIDMDDAWSCHHYPSHVGLNCYKTFQVYPAEAWTISMENRRFHKSHKGWLVIKTEDKQYIGQLLTDHAELIGHLPQDVRVQYNTIQEMINQPTHVLVGFPQINSKRLKRQLKRDRSTVERENLALFSDEDGTVFPYEFVVRAFKGIPLLTGPLQGWGHYGGLDIAKGVGRDWTVITIVAYKRPYVRLVYQWKTNKRRIKEAKQMVEKLTEPWRVQKWYIDANTIGSETVEDLQDTFGKPRIDGIGFQTKDKADLVANMEMLLGDHESPCRIEIPEELTELKHQMKMYQKESIQNGEALRYHHPEWEGEHDDEIVSLMLACLCAKVEEVYDLETYFIPQLW